METTYLVSPADAASQVVFVALVVAVYLAYSGGWLRLFSQRREIAWLYGKLRFQEQARLEKVAEFTSFENAFAAYMQGQLWSLIQTAEEHLKQLRRLVRE